MKKYVRVCGDYKSGLLCSLAHNRRWGDKKPPLGDAWVILEVGLICLYTGCVPEGIIHQSVHAGREIHRDKCGKQGDIAGKSTG
ncbi:MAG: hypothetical protein ROW52_10720 [Anaerolineaceae bacterium]|jgi:hypothetical protein